MQFKVTDHPENYSVPKQKCETQGELMRALSELRKNQSMNIPEDYMQNSRDKRALIAMSCIRAGGPGTFKVRKQKDGSYEAYRVK